MRLPSHLIERLSPLIDRIAGRLRRPTRRELWTALLVPPALFLAYVAILVPLTPGISDIRKATTERPAQILFADGKKLAEFKHSHRQWVPLAEISPHVVDALIATEDHRFYTHHGLDFRRTLAAALHTVRGNRQGGSTLTQQLARNLYPEEIGRAPTLTRKLKEAITAFKIEAVHGKDEILETYLNTVPFLYNAFGIEMAARTYFDTSAGKLNVLQSATLVGMLKGTSYYNPMLNPERSLQRRNVVLTQMAKHGKLPANKLEALKKAPLRLDFERQYEKAGPAPHFAQQLRRWLIDWADRNDYNIYSDGLIVRTTLDSRLQALASRAVENRGQQLQNLANAVWSRRSVWTLKNDLVRDLVRETPDFRKARESEINDEDAIRQLTANPAFLPGLRQQKTMIQAGFLAIDPRNGQIKAWVGSRDFERDAFDHVKQARRQPGSTFKAFVYGEAFRQGISPETTLIDQAVEIPVGDGELWRPSDGKPPSGKAMSLRDGLAYSKNTITAQLMQKVGAPKVVRLARAMGIRQSELDPVPSLALGTSPVSLKEMVTAYATIADSGRFREPVMVTRIEDRHGRVLEEFAAPDPEDILDEDVAYTLLDVMRDGVDRGTAASIRNRFGIRADVAGKTGTTQDNADGWFILMHPQLVAGAWVGFNDPRITLRSDYWGQGAHSALPIVADVVHGALRARLIDTRSRFVPPANDGLMQRLSAQVAQWFAHLTSPRQEAPAEEPPLPRKKGIRKDEDDPLQEVIDKILEEEKKRSEEMHSLHEPNEPGN